MPKIKKKVVTSRKRDQKRHYDQELPDSHESFVNRLHELISNAGTARALAEASGVSPNAISLWLKSSEPGRDKLVAVAKAAGVSPAWLAAGIEPKRGLPEGYVVPSHLETAAGEIFRGVDHVAFKRGWMESLPGALASSALFLFLAEDDAMFPTISRGDLVLANTNDRDVTASGMYVIYAANARPLIRWLALRADGSRQIICENPTYTAAMAAETAAASQFKVLGRAIWSGGLL
jgi:phage repressor protein C with HTH and peptisase S24 domain